MEKTASAEGLFEVRLHGRGGQGAQTAAQVLAEAALAEGKYIQAFPQFGPERRGAPVEAFVRLSSSPILTHANVVSPESVVVLEASLTGAVDVAKGLDENGLLIVNSAKNGGDLKKTLKTKAQLYAFDASELARYFLGRDIPNLIMLGAFSRISGRVEFASLEGVIMDRFARRWGKDLAEKNVIAMRVAYNEAGT